MIPRAASPGPAPIAAAGGSGVCAVVVTYNADVGVLREVLVAALAQVDELYVLDNGSTGEAVARLRALLEELRLRPPVPARLTPIFLPKNLGLPIPFNRAIALARGSGHRFVLLLDHDSILEPGSVGALAASYDRLGCVVPLGALEAINDEPFQLATDDFLEGYHRRKGWGLRDGIADDFLATNSGLFFPVDLVDRVGGFDESFFLDGSDFEFGLRIRARGLRILRVPSARIRHFRGETSAAGAQGPAWRIRKVQPVRHYYVARDMLRVWRRYARRFPLIGLLLLSMPVREGFLVLFFYSDRRTHLAYLARGVLDALQGVSGPIPAPRP